MEANDQVDDRTFRVNFSGGGVLKLRERVTEKLKEYMGDYTDETLVEYVIVLLRNGRRKEEAKTELDVFLDNDSDSFVDWLWEHLSSNLDQYVQVPEPLSFEVVKTKPNVEENAGGNKIHYLESDSDPHKSTRVSNIRRKREWKGLTKGESEHPLNHNTATNGAYPKSKELNCDVNRKKRSVSPQVHGQRKRSLAADHQRCKMTMNAPKRLLQFAVRDAVATNRSSTTCSEPDAKRLRSVVSTCVNESAHPHVTHSIASQPNAMAAAIKAAAEAAEDVSRMRLSARNVFDRLGQSVISEVPILREDDADVEVIDGEIDPVDFCQSLPDHRVDYFELEKKQVEYCSSPEKEQHPVMRPSGTVLASDNVDVCDRNEIRRRERISNSVALQYRVGQDSVGQAIVKQQDPFVSAADKILNTCVNVPNYELHHATEVEGKHEVASKSTTSRPGSYATVHPLEDADARTIFVNNVHYGATKDSLSRHFNQCGEVLKVIIMTDAATGQPKGSAYVEFLRKEASENALSLDGSYFMARMLKVVTKSCAPQELSLATTRPRTTTRLRVPRGVRYARASFPRGCYRPGAYPNRARSMQWRRDAQTPSTDSSAAANSTSAARGGLTYVRTA